VAKNPHSSHFLFHANGRLAVSGLGRTFSTLPNRLRLSPTPVITKPIPRVCEVPRSGIHREREAQDGVPHNNHVTSPRKLQDARLERGGGYGAKNPRGHRGSSSRVPGPDLTGFLHPSS
jgi:hypothetical protein